MLKITMYISLAVFLILKIIDLFFLSFTIFYYNIYDLILLSNIQFNILIEYICFFFNLPIFYLQDFLSQLFVFNYAYSSEIIYDINWIIGYLTFMAQVFFVVIITIWARAAGPRFRLDQLLSLTWKDLFIYINLFLIFILFIVVVV